MDISMQRSQISKILTKVFMICLLFWSLFFSNRNQSGRTVKHHTDYHVHACEVEPENMGMPIIIKMSNNGLPLRYEKEQLLDLKVYMCRSKLNELTLLTIKIHGIKKSFRVKHGIIKKVRQRELNSGSSSTIFIIFKEGCECF